MLEMHALTRYEIAPVVIFDEHFDAATDAAECQTWLRDFCQRRGRPPKLLLFTFREPDATAFNTRVADANADNACRFMKHLIADERTAELLTQVQLKLEFVDMSSTAAEATHARILSHRF